MKKTAFMPKNLNIRSSFDVAMDNLEGQNPDKTLADPDFRSAVTDEMERVSNRRGKIDAAIPLGLGVAGSGVELHNIMKGGKKPLPLRAAMLGLPLIGGAYWAYHQNLGVSQNEYDRGYKQYRSAARQAVKEAFYLGDFITKRYLMRNDLEHAKEFFDPAKKKKSISQKLNDMIDENLEQGESFVEKVKKPVDTVVKTVGKPLGIR